MKGLTDQDWSQIDDIIADIYDDDNTIDLEDIIEKLSDLISFSKSLSCLASNVDEGLTFFDFRSSTIPQNSINDYCKHYIHYDFLLWYSAAPNPIVCRATDIIVHEYMANSIFMKEWLEPLDVHYILLVNIAANDHLYGNIALYRSKEEGDFSDRDIAVMSTLNRHLCSRFKSQYPKGIYYDPSGAGTERIQSKYGLSKKEVDIVRLICQGVPRSELAEALYIGNNTLKNYLSNIYQKMEISSYGDLLNLLIPYYEMTSSIHDDADKKL